MIDETSWTLIRAAAHGDERARAEFVRRYLPVVRAYLVARWGRSPKAVEVEDAVQEVFLECLRDDGVLQRAVGGDTREFRAFLLGVVRNVALRVEHRRERKDVDLDDGSALLEAVPVSEESLSRVFDGAWARSILREATDRYTESARGKGAEAEQRVELLRLRFEQDLPVRRIAELWGVDAAKLHHAYAQARVEFVSALREVVVRRHGTAPDDVQRILRELAAVLG